MTTKEKKEYLKRYRKIDREVNQLLMEKDEIISLGTRITPRYSDLPRGWGESNKVQLSVEKLEAQEEKIDKRVGENQRNHANRHESSPLKERKIKIHAKKHRITKNLTNVFCFQIFPAVLYCGTSEQEDAHYGLLSSKTLAVLLRKKVIQV